MLGVIGGTGLYKMEGLEGVESMQVETPFGAPSSAITIGRLSGKKIAFLPRHGQSHQLLPSEINYRANLWALKSTGVTHVVSVSAVGSLALEVKPAQLALPNQFIDLTKGTRARTYFGDGLVAHISTAEPTCPHLSKSIIEAADSLNIPLHKNVTYACVEGPRLGTKAESLHMQKIGAQIVGMTNVPEVFLAREAQLSYATIAVVTDYDCWLDDPSQHVSVEKVIELYGQNIGKVQQVLKAVVEKFDGKRSTQASEALKYAVMTPEASLTPEKKKMLEFLRK